MDNLTDFLLARIAEDERFALSVKRYRQRFLAECEAKRRIVEHAQLWQDTLHRIPEGWTDQGATAYRMAMQWALERLASVYAADPDYREEWR